MKPIRHTHREGCCTRPKEDPVHRSWGSIDEIIGEYDRTADYRRIDARIKLERAEADRKRRRRERKELAAKLKEHADAELRELGRRVRIALGGQAPQSTMMLLHEDGTAEWVSADGEPAVYERYPPGQKLPGFTIGRFRLPKITIERWVQRAPFRVPTGPQQAYQFLVYTLETAE